MLMLKSKHITEPYAEGERGVICNVLVDAGCPFGDDREKHCIPQKYLATTTKVENHSTGAPCSYT
jgi:hypothetical protein